ncbi:MAG: amino acid adenylation domain-containing protein, partial [bacterium]|nr:amino acid adenylation domain-containing protein [bacterium]
YAKIKPGTRVGANGTRADAKRDAGEYDNQSFSFLLDTQKTAALKRMAARNHVTLNIVNQSVWGILLGKYNGKEDVVFGTVVSGRPSDLEGVESMIGLFINTIPVRIRFQDKMKFRQLIRNVQQDAIAAESHHYHPLVAIQSRTHLKQNLLDHLFIFENYPVAEQIEGYGNDRNKGNDNNDPSSLNLTDVTAFAQTNYDLNVMMSGTDQLSIGFNYNHNVVDEAYVKRLTHHFQLVLEQVTANEELAIEGLTLLSPQEKQQLLFEFNDTAAEYPNHKTIHQLFEEQARRGGDDMALKGPGLSNRTYMSCMSYKELNERTEDLAVELREKGTGPGSIVPFMLERSLEMIVSILSILKAGAACLPIDPEYPQERIDYMLDDSGAQLLLTGEKEVKVLQQSTSPSPPSGTVGLLYLIYTSGSTGKPKATMLEHGNLVNLMSYQYEFTKIDCSRILQFCSISFDMSFNEVFSTLLSGGQLFLINKETRMDIPELFKVIETNEIKTLFFPTAFLRTLFSEEAYVGEVPLCVRHIVTAGEQLIISNKLREYLRERKVYLYNQYGPSETHVVTALTIDPEDEILEFPSIGKPIINTGIYIVDRSSHLLPVGIAGELWIGGDQVGRGYWEREELTKEKFITNPFKAGDRVYRSGDLARWTFDGVLEFLGRIDQQVKIRGFRVELGEVESNLDKHPDIKDAVVMARSDGGRTFLCVYYTLNTAKGAPPAAELKEYLEAKLPDYMVPASFVKLESIPLNPNGKVHRSKLPQPADEDFHNRGTSPVPVTNMQRTIAAVWKERLGRERVGITDDFYELGGNSLDLVAVSNQLRKKLDQEIPVSTLIDNPTISSLAHYLTSVKLPGTGIPVPENFVLLYGSPQST